MRSRRRVHARPRSADEEVGITTDTDTTGAWHPLDLASQAYQAQLEGHRLDPDNAELYQDLMKARAAMDTAWLEHTIQPAAPVIGQPVTRTLFAWHFGYAGYSTLRWIACKTSLHRRKPRP